MFPKMGDPLAKNVFRVIFAGPTCCIVGVGSIFNSVGFEKPSNPMNAITSTTDEIMAPIASDGPWINENKNSFGTFSLF